MSEKQHKATGPNGQCCGICFYKWVMPDGGRVCRRYPVGNSQRVVPGDRPALALLEKHPEEAMPQVETIVDHPYTVDYEWCGEFKRNVADMN